MNLVNPYRFAAGGGGDPDFASVVLLLHMNGTNGGTTFTDNSSSAHTVTAVGNAQTSTAQSKFNGSSGLFDGSGDYLTIPDSDDWHMGLSDFTIECFIRLSTTLGAGVIVAQRTAGYCPFVLYTDAGILRVLLSFTNSSWAGVPTITDSSALSVDTWHYVAFTRSGNDFKLFVNGAQVGSTVSNASSFVNSGNVFAISAPSTGSWNGNLAELRITKGVARDVSTIPTAAFPDS